MLTVPLGTSVFDWQKERHNVSIGVLVDRGTFSNARVRVLIM